MTYVCLTNNEKGNPLSSKRAIRRRACGGKKKFPTRTRAISAAVRISRQTKERLRAYRCRFCRAWHVGHARVPPIPRVCGVKV